VPHRPGSRCGRFPPALALLEATRVSVDALVSDVIGIAEGERAMRRAAEPGVLKVLLAR
jgi:threonine dehydrogenase-like Zn-dependent dehydrogenase